MAEDAVLGIDLGTTNSVIGLYTKKNGIKILTNEKGSTITPSVIAFTTCNCKCKAKCTCSCKNGCKCENTYLIGQKARDYSAKNPKNTISEVKRMIGRKYSELCLQEDINRWPFKVNNINNEPRVQVEYLKETRNLRPEALSAYVLGELRKMACTHLGLPHFTQLNAVVAVPVYFNDSQRLATKEACEIANLNVLSIITEPVAATVAYYMENTNKLRPKTQEIALVFDMGGGTTDVSLVNVKHRHDFTTLGSKGDNHLGGEDLDTKMVSLCCEKIHDEHKIHLTKKENDMALMRLRIAVEKAKCGLSASPNTSINVKNLKNNINISYEITRETFEALCNDVFDKAIKLATDCIAEHKNVKINRVILAGGSTRIPYVRNFLKKLLPGVEMCYSIKQDEAVAFGATMQAAMLKGLLRRNLKLAESIPWSLGINIVGNFTSRVLEKNSLIPAKNTEVFWTSYHNQDAMKFDIREGESIISQENKLLGSMTLMDIKIAPQGQTKADTTFEVDQFGILHVTAVEQGTNNRISVTIERYKKQLTEEEIIEIKSSVDSDNLHKMHTNLSKELDNLVFKIQLHPIQKQALIHEVNNFKTWNMERMSSDDFEILVNQLQRKFQVLGIQAKITESKKITVQGNLHSVTDFFDDDDD